ncbi:MAG TPA: heme-binding protein [Sphingomonas sp.]|nr:heme-binding protein [Sphingomonas sp.]
MRVPKALAALAAAALMLASCGGGGGGSGSTPPPSGGSSGGPTPPTSYYTPPAQVALTAADVGTIIAQAVAEAKARNLPSDIAVTDRVGNVLAVFQMNGARPTATIPTPASGTNLDAQGVTFPAPVGAIAKAITAAYLSSGGDAFTTRTASEIVQEHFPPGPGSQGLESGPLFGVQFSQLPCSDLSARYQAAGGPAAFIGPKRSPIGLSADPGGIPLYKDGVLVGGVGVMGDGVYGFDPNVLDVDQDDEEYIALAAVNGFAASPSITADKIEIGGVQLRYVDASPDKLKSNPASAPGFSAIDGSAGKLIPVRGYYGENGAPALVAGQAYGTEASGIRKATKAEFDNPDAFVLTDGSGHDRFPVRAATDGGAVAHPLTADEVRAILQNAFTIMRRARAQIRQPLDSRAEISIAVADTNGAALGVIRAPDAPIFGTDVALQKARTAAFFSGSHAGTDLSADTSQDVRDFVVKFRAFLNDQSALTGKNAFTDRANGNLSRPFFPDGENGRPNGPFSRPIDQFSPFSTGLQSALIIGNIAQHLAYIEGSGPDTPARCTSLPDSATNQSRIQNGVQIFPGSVPIYRDGVLVGGIGVSGDGVDQDDMISFLGLYYAGQQVGSIGEAPPSIRADQIVTHGVRLRYVNCPIAPFLDTTDQNVCDGK